MRDWKSCTRPLECVREERVTRSNRTGIFHTRGWSNLYAVMIRLKAIIFILILLVGTSCQQDGDTSRTPTKVIISDASSLPDSPVLVYKTVSGDKEMVYVLGIASKGCESFRVPSEAMTPALMKHGICLPCADGKIVLFTFGGVEKARAEVGDAVIVRSVRLSDDKLAILGASFNSTSKGFDFTIRVVEIQRDRIVTRAIGNVPESGQLFSPDACTVFWLCEKEAKHFSVCEEKSLDGSIPNIDTK